MQPAIIKKRKQKRAPIPSLPKKPIANKIYTILTAFFYCQYIFRFHKKIPTTPQPAHFGFAQ